MKISIFTDKTSWLVKYLHSFIEKIRLNHECNIYHDTNQRIEGDIAFFLSYYEIVSVEKLLLHKNNLVVHASDLPNGKGWSPLTWQILEGMSDIKITLFEATKKVDSGDIYLQETMHFKGHELINEMRQELAKTTLNMCYEFIENYDSIKKMAKKQSGKETFYPRRSFKDSKLDINKTIQEQFNLLRVVENESYPAWFEYMNFQYKLKIEKIEND
jgi:methionyl-tRNA formyltransferase